MQNGDTEPVILLDAFRIIKALLKFRQEAYGITFEDIMKYNGCAKRSNPCHSSILKKKIE